jgi:multidrug transporter EmrE-like cation transporter
MIPEPGSADTMTRLLSVLLAFVILTLIVQAISLHRNDQRLKSIAVGTAAALLVAIGSAMIIWGD